MSAVHQRTLVCTIWFSALLLVYALSMSHQVAAQGLLLGGGDDAGPITVEANQGIEWLREEKMYRARGDAIARRGDVTVYADELAAHYRDKKTSSGEGKSEIWRLDAVGNVRIVSPNEAAFGDRARYDADEAVLVLVGDDLRFETPDQIVTARDSLEYWEQKQLAVARGDANAKATDEEKEISADVLTLVFQSDSRGELKARRMDAFGNVVIMTPQEVARGDQGVYDVATGIATLDGHVKITRGENQVNGDRAEVDLNTGISRLLATNDGTGNRVHGLLVPDGDSNPSPISNSPTTE